MPRPKVRDPEGWGAASTPTPAPPAPAQVVSLGRIHARNAQSVGIPSDKARKGARAAAASIARPRDRKPLCRDASTSERYYDDDETELIRAVAAYQARTGRRFPSVCEILAVVKQLGYRKP